MKNAGTLGAVHTHTSNLIDKKIKHRGKLCVLMLN